MNLVLKLFQFDYLKNGTISSIRTVLQVLFKGFDTINYDLLMVKLHAYDFEKKWIRLDLAYNYFKNRGQRLKINTTFSTWISLISGVPHGSVLGPQLFNIFLSNLFFFLQDANICKYADNTTPFACNETL